MPSLRLFVGDEVHVRLRDGSEYYGLMRHTQGYDFCHMLTCQDGVNRTWTHTGAFYLNESESGYDIMECW